MLLCDSPLSKDGISRRRVLQGAAWAAPAVMIASAAPAAAASAAIEGGMLLFTSNHAVAYMDSYADKSWSQARTLLIDPDIVNASLPGGLTASGITLTFAVPKAWLPGGKLTWHGYQTYSTGGGTPPFTVTITESSTAYVFLLTSTVELAPNHQPSWSPEYRIEIDPNVDIVGQTILQTARGTAGTETWVTHSLSTVISR